MNRRDLVANVGMAVVIPSVMTGVAMAKEKAAKKENEAALAPNKYVRLAKVVHECVSTGLICIKHCQTELAQGNKVMAECLQSVLELVSACQNLEQLALYESRYTAEFAKLTAKICADCSKICEKHAHHMEACKACFEACKACEKECLSFA